MVVDGIARRCTDGQLLQVLLRGTQIPKIHNYAKSHHGGIGDTRVPAHIPYTKLGVALNEMQSSCVRRIAWLACIVRNRTTSEAWEASRRMAEQQQRATTA